MDAIKVLLVDDSDAIRTLLRYSFGSDPRFQIVGEAYDGRSAMRAVEIARPDVIVLDLMMPNMDGFHAIPQITMGSPEAKILVLTNADVSEESLISKGAHKVLCKEEALDTFAVTEAAANLFASYV